MIALLEDMQAALLQKASVFRDGHLIRPKSLGNLTTAFSDVDTSPFALGPMDVSAEREEAVQSVLTEHKLSIRCLPEAELGELDPDDKCIFTGKRPTHVALIGRSY